MKNCNTCGQTIDMTSYRDNALPISEKVEVKKPNFTERLDKKLTSISAKVKGSQALNTIRGLLFVACLVSGFIINSLYGLLNITNIVCSRFGNYLLNVLQTKPHDRADNLIFGVCITVGIIWGLLWAKPIFLFIAKVGNNCIDSGAKK